MSSAVLPHLWHSTRPARPAASAGMAPLVAWHHLVAMAPLAHSVLSSALVSMKQAVPTAWQGCPQVLRALAGRSCWPWAARCLQRGAFPVLMRLGRLGQSSPSALIKVLAVLPGRVGGLGPIGCSAGDTVSRCAPSRQGGGGGGSSSGAGSPAR